MHVEIGPASLVITAKKGGRAFAFERAKVEAGVKSILVEIGAYLPLLKQKAYRIKNVNGLPPTVRSMVLAAQEVDEEGLTPLAAVAGAVSDALKEFLKTDHPDVIMADMIMVNNGGDISIFNGTAKTLGIGIGDIATGSPTPYVLRIGGINGFGIATSGFGGRSFTLGLADLATVVAATGALADAAATFLGNRTNVPTDAVTRQRAGDIDPLTDIPDELVTIRIGAMDPELVMQALRNGIAEAGRLKARGIIHEALIVVKGEMAATMSGGNSITLEVERGD
jgi:ApbE superfamily uncharacterized protein (UPF0280 family)